MVRPQILPLLPIDVKIKKKFKKNYKTLMIVSRIANFASESKSVLSYLRSQVKGINIHRPNSI